MVCLKKRRKFKFKHKYLQPNNALSLLRRVMDTATIVSTLKYVILMVATAVLIQLIQTFALNVCAKVMG
jgi:hypothetical protein